jgi:hypothetical protein
MQPINNQYIFRKEDSNDMLLVSLQLKNLIPKTGNGRVEIVFQDDVLLHTICSERDSVKLKVKDVLKKFFNVD